MKKILSRLSRQKRVRGQIKNKSQRPRLTVFRSNRYLWAQIIDDQTGKTLVSASDLDLAKGKDHLTKIAKASQIGQILAAKAQKKDIKKVVFDRGAYQYHGRVKALAEEARKGGLIF